MAAALALAAALLRPGFDVPQARYEHVVVLDITQSMNVADYTYEGKPESRLAHAKRLLRHALLSLPCGSKLGWAVFTEYRTFLLLAPVEVCANLSELRSTLDHIDGRVAWVGNSEVAKGLGAALAICRQLPGVPSLLFVSDGHEAPPVSARHRPKMPVEPGAVAGLLIGAGDLVPLPIPKLDPAGRPLGHWGADEVLQTDPYSRGRGGSVPGERMVEEGPAEAALPMLGATPGTEHLSALREEYLKRLAAETGLGYQRLADEAALVAALRAPALQRPAVAPLDLSPWLAAIALLALLARAVRHRILAR